jgi:hypothetical protein
MFLAESRPDWLRADLSSSENCIDSQPFPWSLTTGPVSSSALLSSCTEVQMRAEFIGKYNWKLILQFWSTLTEKKKSSWKYLIFSCNDANGAAGDLSKYLISPSTQTQTKIILLWTFQSIHISCCLATERQSDSGLRIRGTGIDAWNKSTLHVAIMASRIDISGR